MDENTEVEEVSDHDKTFSLNNSSYLNQVIVFQENILYHQMSAIDGCNSCESAAGYCRVLEGCNCIFIVSNQALNRTRTNESFMLRGE